MRRLGEAPRLAVATLVYAVRSGRWWTPIILLALAVAAGVVTVASHVIPVSVYVLF